MLGKFTRGTVLAILAWLIVTYVFSTAGKSEPPPPSNQVIGYMST
ncbi:MAG TPA: hypothetical protein VFT69_14285 [Pseudolabrys sp.]|jgi:hypothetical protein|nr:hypothetical protein [Pseudolabrys sp.]